MDEKILYPAYRILTRRMVLRCWEPKDAFLLKEAVDSSIDHLRPFMPWAHQEPTSLQVKIDLLRSFRAKFDLSQDYVYGVFDQEEARVLGGTGLHTRRGSDILEIGYWIRKDATHQGLATELSMALVKVAFELHQVHRVEIRCVPENVYSAAVPRKLGFTYEGTLRQAIPTQAERSDSMIWGMVADEYSTSPAASIEIEAFDALGRRLI
jgi:RimJ/RimL family protein N-acetyltransferase